MNSFKELIFSFFEASRERLKNPAIGSFALAWIAINWRIVAVLFFSETKLEDRISLIEECYLRLDLNLWFPILAMIVYMLVIPNLMAIFDALSQKAISFRKQLSNKNKLSDIEAKNELRLNDVIAQQEIAAEERQLEIIEHGIQESAKLKDQITKLEAERDELKKTSESTVTTNQATPKPSEQSKQTVAPSQTSTSKKQPKPKKKEDNDSKSLPTSPDYPAMRDNVIRNVAKSEREWVLLYGFYASNFGKSEFTRKDIVNAYSESKRKTAQRINNLTQSINTLVKQGSIRFLNEEEILLTDSGITLANEILDR